MNMTDPIADMLTRIRNAVAARHTKVSIPASKMKLAIARVLKEEGYIKDIEFLKDTPQGTIRLTLRYVDKGARLDAVEARQQARAASLYQTGEHPPRTRWTGRRHSVNATGTDDGPSCLHARTWRRSRLLRLVDRRRIRMSRIGRAPISVPPKVQVTWTDENFVTVKGPKGELSYQVDPDLTLKLEDGSLSRHAAIREQRTQGKAWPLSHAGQQYG